MSADVFPALDRARATGVPVLATVVANLRPTAPRDALTFGRAAADGRWHREAAGIVTRTPAALLERACTAVVGSSDSATVASWLQSTAALVLATAAPADPGMAALDAAPPPPPGVADVHPDVVPFVGRLRDLAHGLADAAGGLVVTVKPMQGAAGVCVAGRPLRIALAPSTLTASVARVRFVLAHELSHGVLFTFRPDTRSLPTELQERMADPLARRVLAPGVRPTVERAVAIAERIIAAYVPGDGPAVAQLHHERADGLAAYLWWWSQPCG